MDLSELDYDLPSELIAQTPASSRDASRLLVVDRARGGCEDHVFAELPDLLRPGDCLVVNSSRVIPARVLARDAGGRPVELLFVEPIDPRRWRALVRPGRRCRAGVELMVDGAPESELRIVSVAADGSRVVERLDDTIEDLMRERGLPPLPPYIRRFAAPTAEDRERYQTVYARAPGSIAAPTAGLHFTEKLLEQIRSRGVRICFVTLHIGLGTFAPVKAGTLEEHVMHEERFEISAPTAQAIHHTRQAGRRVIAVGTTTVRVLESVAAANQGRLVECQGRTRIFIHPPHLFHVADALLTNFHLPRSTLLMLVSAFAAPGQTRGRELILSAYAEAIRERYRFYSYGDAMLILP